MPGPDQGVRPCGEGSGVTAAIFNWSLEPAENLTVRLRTAQDKALLVRNRQAESVVPGCRPGTAFLRIFRSRSTRWNLCISIHRANNFIR